MPPLLDPKKMSDPGLISTSLHDSKLNPMFPWSRDRFLRVPRPPRTNLDQFWPIWVGSWVWAGAQVRAQNREPL